MKNFLLAVFCTLITFGIVKEANASYAGFIGVWKDGVLAGTNNTNYIYITTRSSVAVGSRPWSNESCSFSSIGTNCNMTFYVGLSTVQNAMDAVHAIQVDFLEPQNNWVTNQKWFVHRAGNNCGWVGDLRLDSYAWWYVTTWSQPSSILVNRYSNFTRMHTYRYLSMNDPENYTYECFMDNIPRNTISSWVYPIAEVQYQYIGNSTWYGKQFGVYMPTV
jgi:hypothetical protein